MRQILQYLHVSVRGIVFWGNELSINNNYSFVMKVKLILRNFNFSESIMFVTVFRKIWVLPIWFTGAQPQFLQRK